MRFYKLVFLLFTILEANNITFLNKAQRNWIHNLKSPIVVGITKIPNQILVTKQGYKGFCIDLFNIISKKTHIKFKYKYFNTWNEVLNAAKNKKIDVVFLAQKTPLRLSYLDFTNSVLILQNKIIVNIHKDKFTNLKQLKNKRVAVTRGSALEEYLSYNYPNIILLLTNNELESLRLLNRGKVDAAISGSVRASYYINKYNFNNLLIGNTMDYNYYLSIASRSDEPILNVILDKSVIHLNKEIKALELKWGYVKDKVVFFDNKTLIFISILFLILLVFIIYSVVINSRLTKEIEEKNNALERIKQIRDSKVDHMGEMINIISQQCNRPIQVLSKLENILMEKFQKNQLSQYFMENFNYTFQRQIEDLNKITNFKNFLNTNEKIEKFDVDEIINHSIYFFKEEFDYNKIKIEYNPKEEEYISVGYKNSFFQVMINLLYNSKDALLQNKIENKKIKIDINKTDLEIIVIIEDNAGGIPLELLDKVFQPYFSTKLKKQGTGLGLYMAKIIIEEKFHGKIDLLNIENGTKVEIKLPLA